MSIEWQSLTLGDLGRIVTGKTPKTADQSNFGGSIPFVTPSDMDGRKSIGVTARYISEKGAKSISGARIPAGAVMVSCIGSDMGKVAIATHDSVTNQQINTIVVSDRFCSEYVYYNLSTRKDELRHQAASGSAQPILNKSSFSKVEITLPPIAQQRAIAAVLKPLDDKIEQNRRTSEVLERMARSIFRAWIVDFEPVRTKAAGAASFPSMPHDVFDALPTEFVDSPIGPIPNGWSTGPVESLCSSVSSGGTPSRKRAEFWDGGTIPWFKTGELFDGPLYKPSEYITQTGLASSACKLWPRGTILFALYASPTVGRLGVLIEQGTSNQAAAGLIAKPEVGVPFLMQTLLLTREELQRIAVGAAQQNINLGVLKAHKVTIPPGELSSAFSSFCTPILELRERLLVEDHRLASLRDYLLPKLLSGKVRVRDAERLAESA